MKTILNNTTMKTIVKTPHFSTAFDSFLGKEWNETFAPALFGGYNVPAVNIAENEGGFRIELAAPGLKKEDLKLNLERNVLTISAQKEVVAEQNTEKYTRKEFSFNSFNRSFTLPQSVDIEQIGAVYENGVLNVTLPKKEEAKTKEPRLIEVA
jgi:HSP20 family protein